MPTDIPTDDYQYNKLVQKVSIRYLRSVQDSAEDFEKCRRMERWWRQQELDAANGDEYAIRLGYAFSIVERMHAKITEPLFQMGLPCETYPRRLGDAAAAKKMQYIQKNFYAGPNFQEALSKSKKSMCIVGHRWEFDGWQHIVRNGKMWGKVQKTIETPLKKNPDGSPMMDGPMGRDIIMVPGEVSIKRPVHYGFNTEFPRWDEVHPEPGRTTIDTGQKTDMSWLIRDLGYLALEDLAKEMRFDPNSKTDVPLYDFAKLLHAAGKNAELRYDKIMRGESGSEDRFGTLIQPIRAWDYQASQVRGRGDNRMAQDNAMEDRDKIWVAQHRENGEILTIAQGKYIIHRMLDPWHVPGLKARIENYTTDPDRLRGKGAIEPIEGELGEFDDMHSLSMQNIFRIVNRMTYVRQDAIVNEDDFDSRSGGLVRIKSDVADVRNAVSEAQQNSPVNEMLAVESDLRGIIEFVSMELDGAPGVKGTKQNHKTKGGMDDIITNMSPSYARWQRQARINECRRCMNMADILAQFHFDKMPYRIVRPDGSTSFAEFSKEDIDTEGRGFDFGYSVDPMWGNPQQKLAMKQAVYVAGVEYMKIPKSIRGENSRDVNLDNLFEDILTESGYTDTSAIFKASDGSMSPEEELEKLAQGAILPGCKGDLIHHIQVHLLQLSSPGLKIAIEAKKANPDTPKNLQLLISQAMAALKTFLSNPQGAAQKRLAKAGMHMPGPQANPGAEMPS